MWGEGVPQKRTIAHRGGAKKPANSGVRTMCMTPRGFGSPFFLKFLKQLSLKLDQDALYSDHTFNLESAGSKFENCDNKSVRNIVSTKLRNAIHAGR